MLRSPALPSMLTPMPTAARGQSKNASRDPKRQCKGDRARPLLVLTRKDPFFEVTLLNSVPRKITVQNHSPVENTWKKHLRFWKAGPSLASAQGGTRFPRVRRNRCKKEEEPTWEAFHDSSSAQSPPSLRFASPISPRVDLCLRGFSLLWGPLCVSATMSLVACSAHGSRVQTWTWSPGSGMCLNMSS